MHCNLKYPRRTTWQLAKQTMTRGCDINLGSSASSRRRIACRHAVYAIRDQRWVRRGPSPLTHKHRHAGGEFHADTLFHTLHQGDKCCTEHERLALFLQYSTMQCTGTAVIQTRCVSKTLQRTRYVDPIASKENTPAEFTGHRHSQRRYPRKYRRPRSSRQQRPTRESVKTI
jgi:hypothetical protein